MTPKNKKVKHTLSFIDAPDPDNLMMDLGLIRLFPDNSQHTVLTGRPLRFNPDRFHALWDWDPESSRMAQQVSAARIKKFMERFGVDIPKVYDGGIAPRTVVPHWVHFAEYHKFEDVDPLSAIRRNPLDPIEDLIREILTWEDASAAVVVGGPMTGLGNMITRCPEVIPKFKEVHAMFATWGTVGLMEMEVGTPRGKRQFNAACDPFAAFQVLMGLPCPIYLMPTEVTRVEEIGFMTADALKAMLPSNVGTNALSRLYATWYDVAVRPRQEQQRAAGKRPTERIWIHDLAAALSLNAALREQIYTVVPVKIGSIPSLPYDGVTDEERARYAAEGKPVPADLHWGEVRMRQTTATTNIYAATGLAPGGAEVYLQTLYDICK